MTTTYMTYRLAAADMTKTLDRVAKAPQTAREIAYWKANVSNAKDVDAFVSDKRLFNFAMKAFGLQDMGYAKAFMKKLLTEGTAQGSMASRMSDQRYREFAKTFNFASFGTATTTLSEVTDDVVTRYLRQNVEESAGQSSEGVRLALYFQRKAADIVSPMQLLADPALLKVTQTALGLPTSMSSVDIDKQVEMISKKLDVADFQDPAKLDKFLKRFSALYDLNNSSGAASSPAISMLQSSGSGLNVDTLMSLAKLKTGG
jgi:hypothetical protein